MLAMVVDDDSGNLTPRGALRFFASMLAPARLCTPEISSESRYEKR